MFCSLEDELGIKIKRKLNIGSWFDAYYPVYANPYVVDRSYRSWDDVVQQYRGQIDDEATRARMRDDFATTGWTLSNGNSGYYTVSPTINSNVAYNTTSARYNYSNLTNTINVVTGEN